MLILHSKFDLILYCQNLYYYCLGARSNRELPVPSPTTLAHGPNRKYYGEAIAQILVYFGGPRPEGKDCGDLCFLQLCSEDE